MIKFLPALMCPSTKEEEDKEKKKAEGKEPPTGLSVSCYKLWQARFPKSGTHICTSDSPGFWKRGKCMFRLIKVNYQLFILQQISYFDKLISAVALHLSIFWHKQLFSIQFEFSIFTPEHFSFIEILFSVQIFHCFSSEYLYLNQGEITRQMLFLCSVVFLSVFLQFRISRTRWRWRDSTFSFSVSSRLSMSASSSHIGSTS